MIFVKGKEEDKQKYILIERKRMKEKFFNAKSKDANIIKENPNPNFIPPPSKKIKNKRKNIYEN